jgi:hypothetical protein
MPPLRVWGVFSKRGKLLFVDCQRKPRPEWDYFPQDGETVRILRIMEDTHE